MGKTVLVPSQQSDFIKSLFSKQRRRGVANTRARPDDEQNVITVAT
jgi:hypothetical protein